MDTARLITVCRSPEYALVPVKIPVLLELLLLVLSVVGVLDRLLALDKTLLTVPIDYSKAESNDSFGPRL